MSTILKFGIEHNRTKENKSWLQRLPLSVLVLVDNRCLTYVDTLINSAKNRGNTRKLDAWDANFHPNQNPALMCLTLPCQPDSENPRVGAFTPSTK